MSIRNVDRHGLGNLRKEGTKPLDRLKVPPFIVYGLVIGLSLYFMAKMDDNEELKFINLQRKNTLLAMKRTQEKIEY